MRHSIICDFIKKLYDGVNPVPLHEPVFYGREREYLLEAIDSTYVSTIGKYVTAFENSLRSYTGSAHAVVVTNGTSALHLALQCAGVTFNDLVITQSLTFVGTCNAIAKLGARPIFCDISENSLSLSPSALLKLLSKTAYKKNGKCFDRKTSQQIKAVVPVHTFGHSGNIEQLANICNEWNLELIEDAAEAIGSQYNGKHVGTFGRFGIISFNGNKTITCGSGGAILCRDADDAENLRHVSSTGKVPHKYESFHNIEAFNYRMSNLNAAVGLAQMERIEHILDLKRQLASKYEEFFEGSEIVFHKEPINTKSNYWLNTIIFKNIDECKRFLELSNDSSITSRAAWRPMHKLPMYKSDIRGPLTITDQLAERIANLPSSANFSSDA
jgi:aminotransferase in exopolysaccharide biosynthesis